MIRSPLFHTRSGWTSLPGNSLLAASASMGKAANTASVRFESTGMTYGMPSTKAYRPASFRSRSGWLMDASLLLQLCEDAREGIPRCVLSHEDIEMSVPRHDVQGVPAPALLV